MGDWGIQITQVTPIYRGVTGNHNANMGIVNNLLVGPAGWYERKLNKAENSLPRLLELRWLKRNPSGHRSKAR